MRGVARRAEAFTRTELLVVLAVVAALLFLLVPAINREKGSSSRVACVNNLSQIGIAYRVWANENGDHFPVDTPETNGGWHDLLSLTNAGTYAWTNYAAMGNELGQFTSTLICPSDERQPASDFASVSNANVSYFIGVGVSDSEPQAILAGDRNLGPGGIPDPDYGYSPTNGTGNDVVIKGPVCWSLKMHSEGKSSGAGDIMLADGSAQQVTTENLNLTWLKPTTEDTDAQNRGTNVAGIRLIFP